MKPIIISFIFLSVNVLILLLILYLNRRPRQNSSKEDTLSQDASDRHLKASDILGWEFEYARITASEAMRDRHTMINYYLLIVGIVTTGVVAVLKPGDNYPNAIGIALLWLLCVIGWLYFLKIIRLRQAWHSSAQAMNWIKEFYIQHVEEFNPEVLRSAFLWKAGTLPRPGKPWTLYFLSAMLISLLDSVAYVAGGILIWLKFTTTKAWRSFLPILAVLAIFGLAFFVFHILLYFAFLKENPSSKINGDGNVTHGQ